MQLLQISIFLENRPGQLGPICRDLAAASVNIATLTVADTSDFGIIRMIVDDHEKAYEVLKSSGRIVKVTPVVAVRVPDRPGGMASVTEALGAAGVNIEYSYAFAIPGAVGQAVLVFRFDDNAKAEAALKAAGFITLTEDDVGGRGK